VNVLDGNDVRLQGACPWWDALPRDGGGWF
jgi:hypothetical protein